VSVDDVRMSFTEHLGELRIRLIRASFALVASIFICYLVSNYVIKVLAYPLTPLVEHGLVVDSVVESEISTDDPTAGVDDQTPAPTPIATTSPRRPVFTVFNPLEFILVKVKIAVYCGVLLAFPFILWQVCAFIFPGLHPNERQAAKILIFGCSFLALSGVLVAYLGVLPLVMPYLLVLVPADFVAVDQLRLNETIKIIGLVITAFAVAFQFPMAVLILVYLGILSPQTLKRSRKVALIIMSVISALLTPADPISMIIMLVPLVLLYEISILLSYVVVWRKKKSADAV